MASTIYDLEEMMNRLLAMEKEAVPDSGGAIYWPYSQSKTPYWINQFDLGEIDYSISSERVIDTYFVLAGLVIDHYDAGYEGAHFIEAYRAYIPDVLQFFDDNPDLTSTEFPDPLRYIANIQNYSGAYIRKLPSTRLVMNSGLGVHQVVLQFSIAVPLWRQQY